MHIYYLFLSKANRRPPIKDKFLTNGKISKGAEWKIMVVGTKKINNNDEASFILFVNIRSAEPVIKIIIAKIKSIAAIDSGNPLLTIKLVWAEKFVILPGIAFTKIALKRSLPRKFIE